MHRIGLSLTLAILATGTVEAQTRTIRSISADGAQQAVAAARAEAQGKGWNMSIAVVDPWGDLIAFIRMDAASPATIQNALGKARTAARFRRPTQVYDSLVVGRPGLLNFENMTPLEGGIPIVIEDAIVGAIGVSGGSSAQDAEVARAAAKVVKP